MQSYLVANKLALSDEQTYIINILQYINNILQQYITTYDLQQYSQPNTDFIDSCQINSEINLNLNCLSNLTHFIQLVEQIIKNSKQVVDDYIYSFVNCMQIVCQRYNYIVNTVFYQLINQALQSIESDENIVYENVQQENYAENIKRMSKLLKEYNNFDPVLQFVQFEQNYLSAFLSAGFFDQQQSISQFITTLYFSLQSDNVQLIHQIVSSSIKNCYLYNVNEISDEFAYQSIINTINLIQYVQQYMIEQNNTYYYIVFLSQMIYDLSIKNNNLLIDLLQDNGTYKNSIELVNYCSKILKDYQYYPQFEELVLNIIYTIIGIFNINRNDVIIMIGYYTNQNNNLLNILTNNYVQNNIQNNVDICQQLAYIINILVNENVIDNVNKLQFYSNVAYKDNETELFDILPEQFESDLIFQ